MSLTTKYRPQTWDEIIGQSHIIDTLKHAVISKNLHNSYLLVGLRGTGKTTSARILAKALNCPNVKDGEPCNICQSCESVTRGNSLDVKELDMATNRGIDDVRAIKELISYAPAQGKYRVIICDEAHQMTPQAASALLKALEEPPKNVIWILCTTEVHKILPTIRSRCQVYSFKKVAENLIAKRLINICFQESELGADDIGDVCALIAKGCEGSVRDGESRLASLISGGEVSVEKYQEIFGVLSKGSLENFLALCKAGDKIEIIIDFDKIAEEISEPSRWALEFATHVLDLIGTDSANADYYFKVLDYVEDYTRQIYNNQPILFLKLMLLKIASLTYEKKESKQGKNDYGLYTLAEWFGAKTAQLDITKEGLIFTISVGGVDLVITPVPINWNPYILYESISKILALPKNIDKNDLIEKGLIVVP